MLATIGASVARKVVASARVGELVGRVGEQRGVEGVADVERHDPADARGAGPLGGGVDARRACRR